jgi:hypothetical protein
MITEAALGLIRPIRAVSRCAGGDLASERKRRRGKGRSSLARWTRGTWAHQAHPPHYWAAAAVPLVLPVSSTAQRAARVG